MGAIADYDQLINTLTGGTGASEQIWFYQDNRIGSGAGAATVAGQFTSLWTFNTFPGGQGAAPGGTARKPTRATNGALGQSNPTGGRQKFLCGAGFQSNVAGVGFIYDRLADISGLSATVTTAQTITGLSVDRYTGAESSNNIPFFEIYTLIGTTLTTATIEYTNQDGVTGQISKPVVFGGTGRREATRMIAIPLADGDTGVRAVTNVDLLGSTAIAGDFGVTIARPIVNCPIGLAGTGTIVDLLAKMPTLREIKTDACLSAIWYASTTTSPNNFGTLSMVEA